MKTIYWDNKTETDDLNLFISATLILVLGTNTAQVALWGKTKDIWSFSRQSEETSKPLSNIKIGAFWVKIKEILMGVSEPFSQVLGPVLQLTDLSVKSTIQ